MGKGKKESRRKEKWVRKAVLIQEGKISSRGSYRRKALEDGTVFTIWGRRMEVVAPEMVLSLSGPLRGPSTVSKEAERGFRDLLSQVILPLHFVRVVLQLNHLPH